MTTARLLPMETEFNYAPGMHQKAYLATAGSNPNEIVCGNTLETLCENCQANQGKATYVFERKDNETGRQWKSRIMARSVEQARATLSEWAGKKNVQHIY